MKKSKRKESERSKFERWWQDFMGMVVADIRAHRSENGYDIPGLDYAWFGWQARAKLESAK